jgi:cytochrome c
MKKILVLGVFALFIACNSSSNNVALSDTSSSLATDSTKVIVAADSTLSASENTVEATPEANAEEVKPSAAAAVKPVAKTIQPDVKVVKAPQNNDHADIKKGELLISKSDCFACHKVQDKLLGPAYKDVANKYENTKANVDYLVNKVKTGGSGVWGAVPMSPHPALSDDDARSMISYILSLK